MRKYKFNVRTEEYPDREGRRLKLEATLENNTHCFPVMFREDLVSLRDYLNEYLKES